ncbi:MAG: ATP-binding protein [Magnetovibrionaceae bacterium]
MPVNDRIKAAFDSIAEGIALFSPEDRLVYCNQKYKEYWSGIADILVPGMHWREGYSEAWDRGLILNKENLSREAWINSRERDHEAGDTIVERHLAPDLWVLVKDRRSAAGDIVSVVSDISRIKQVELALRESEERFRDFAETASDWFWEQDKDFRFTFVSQRFAYLTGIPTDSLIGRCRADIYQDRTDLNKSVWKRVEEEQRNHRSYSGVTLPIRLNGGTERFLRISGRPIFGIDGKFKGYRGVGFDVTEQVQDEHRMTAALEEAARAAEAKSAFLANVSHELRTPLTSIHGVLSLLDGGALGELPERARDMVRTALQNSERLTRLVNDLLDIEKIQAGKISLQTQMIDVASLVSKAVNENQPYAERLDVSLMLDDRALAPMIISGDESRLAQVMANLLSNAAKFSEPGTKVIARVELANNAARISVIDHGRGIPDSFRPQMFLPFSQVDTSDSRDKSGTGLGLSICKVIIDAHGGLLDYVSEPGTRTEFFAELPLPKPPQRQRSARPKAAD